MRLFVAALCVSAFPLFAQSDTVNWRAAARQDVEAAYQLILTNHPGAHPLVKDTLFQHALERSVQVARQRVERVTTPEGYRAVLRGFAVPLGDSHIGVEFTAPAATFRWPGIIVRRRGRRFEIGAKDSTVTDVQPGETLVSCDGTAVDTFAKERLGGFRTLWTVEADIVRTAFYLLLDDGNPFTRVPNRCTFRSSAGQQHEVALAWRPTTPQEFTSHLTGVVSSLGTPKTGIRERDGVYWISMTDMDESADSMLAQLAGEKERAQSARAIVIDVRTNGGGSSSKGDAVVKSLFGPGAPDHAYGNITLPGYDQHFRVTPFVVETFDLFYQSRSKTYGPDSDEARPWGEQAKQIRQAMARGEPFWPPIKRVPARERTERRDAPNAIAQKTVVLTDNLCFSSCLMFVAQLRALGVTQIGLSTNENRRYMEVRSTLLPSGRAQFSTLQKVSFGWPYSVGPFLPDIEIPLAMINPDSAETWANTQALALAAKRKP